MSNDYVCYMFVDFWIGHIGDLPSGSIHGEHRGDLHPLTGDKGGDSTVS